MTDRAPAKTGLWRDVRRQFLRHKGAVFGAYLFAGIVLAVLLGPALWSIAPDELDFSARNAAPSLAHPFGTDQLGRDVLAQVLLGDASRWRSGWRPWCCRYVWARWWVCPPGSFPGSTGR